MIRCFARGTGRIRGIVFPRFTAPLLGSGAVRRVAAKLFALKAPGGRLRARIGAFRAARDVAWGPAGRAEKGYPSYPESA
ncbi:hypothetical protein BJG92_00412 [Arthrobacter sp. SO5]|nr:hypothetical protein [Arthrobacter sp. SO5]